MFKKRLKNVGEAAKARQKLARKRSLYLINEYFELVFNNALATQLIIHRFFNFFQTHANNKAASY